MMSLQVKCPCGRRKVTLAVAEGREPTQQSLECDATCLKQQRARQLADAFGAPPEAQGHLSVWERNRDFNYPPELIAFARTRRDWAQDVEGRLSAFVEAGPSARRVALPAMPKATRRLVHILAEQYGLTSMSHGQGTRRHVELYRGANAGLPRKSLCQVAQETTPEELERLLAEVEARCLYLTSVEPDLNPTAYLREFAERMVVTGGGSSELRCLFETRADAESAAAALGGGRKGKFVLDRTRGWCATQPSTAAKRDVAPSGDAERPPAGGAAQSNPRGGLSAFDMPSEPAAAAAASQRQFLAELPPDIRAEVSRQLHEQVSHLAAAEEASGADGGAGGVPAASDLAEHRGGAMDDWEALLES
ncbi:unnamed protein product [Pedinophyceae sp. YPF-701]|nr:unnamed protein product [Pedinophyceae sp. YPF-701]